MTRSLLAFVAVLALGGCAASVEKREPPLVASAAASKNVVYTLTGSQASTSSTDWESFKGAWFDACKPRTEKVGAEFSSSPIPPKAGSGVGTSIIIHVNDYRFLANGARYSMKFLAGSAFVDARVQFRDVATGRLLGERIYNTSASAWQMMFSPMTDQQLAAICDEIVSEIKLQ